MRDSGETRNAPDLVDELKSLTATFEDRGIPYALCGGLAMAVHGHERATVDIDLLVLAEDLESAQGAVRDCGFTLRSDPMGFAGGRVRIRRLSKLEPGWDEPLPVDLILATPELQEIWGQRREFEWAGGNLWVLSREGLQELKRLRGSPQDLADIEKLDGDAG